MALRQRHGTSVGSFRYHQLDIKISLEFRSASLRGTKGFLIVTEHVMLNIFGSATLQLELFGTRVPVTGAVCGALDLQGKFSVTRYYSEYYDMMRTILGQEA